MVILVKNVRPPKLYTSVYSPVFKFVSCAYQVQKDKQKVFVIFWKTIYLKNNNNIVKIPLSAPCIATLVETVSIVLVQILWVETSCVEGKQLHQ